MSTLITRRRIISFGLFEVTGKEGDGLAYTWKHVGQNLVNISPEQSADEPKLNVNSKPKDSPSCPKDSSRILIITRSKQRISESDSGEPDYNYLDPNEPIICRIGALCIPEKGRTKLTNKIIALAWLTGERVNMDRSGPNAAPSGEKTGPTNRITGSARLVGREAIR